MTLPTPSPARSRASRSSGVAGDDDELGPGRRGGCWRPGSRARGRRTRRRTSRRRGRAGRGRCRRRDAARRGGSRPRRDRVAGPSGRRRARCRRAAPARAAPRVDAVAERGRREDHAVRAEGRAGVQRTVSMLMIRSWNRWVCRTQPRLTLDAVAQPDQVGLGQPVGLAPHAARRSGRPSERSQTTNAGVASWPRTNHGTASISTNMSASSLRQTKRLHSGWSTCAVPADQHPLGQRSRSPPPRRRPTSSDRAGEQPRRPARRARSSRRPAATAQAEAEQRPRAAAGTMPAELDERSLHLDRASAGANVRLSSPLRGAAAQLAPAGCPAMTCPALARSGRRGQHGDQAVLGHDAAGAGHAGVAEERPLADLGPLDPHPAAGQLVGPDQGVVGQERVVADGRHPRQHQHRRRLDAATDGGAERAHPDRREQAGVERVEVGARVVHQPLGRPDLPADPAAHRVVALAQAAGRAAGRRPG